MLVRVSRVMRVMIVVFMGLFLLCVVWVFLKPSCYLW